MPKQRPPKTSKLSDGGVRLIWSYAAAGYDVDDYPAYTDHAALSPRHPGALRRATDRMEVRAYEAAFATRGNPKSSGFGGSIFGPEELKPTIVPRGGEVAHNDIGLFEPDMLVDLVNSARQPGEEGALSFVNKWGVLAATGWTSSGLRTMLLSDFEERRTELVECYRIVDEVGAHGYTREKFTEEIQRKFAPHRRDDGKTVPGLGLLHARFDDNGRFLLQPMTLEQLAYLQIGQRALGRIATTECRNCGRLLALGTDDGQTKTGRPRMYCDGRCTTAAFRKDNRERLNGERRAKRARQRRQGKTAI
jgi:hypothetical protein